jgi:tRNA A-37 threonylcarbamoyl transferase component Bud32
VSEEANSAAANVSPGETIAGYRLEEQIGQGGMAVVYRAHDERLDRRVALKLLAPGLASDTAFRTRFIRESRAAAAVDHPNIIPVYDAGDAGGFLFIAMRYVQGGDVRSLFASGQVLSPARVWNIVSQVAAALDAAHAHDLIHRDVKPANMLLDTSARNTGGKRGQVGDETDHVYLSDFGISKQTLASHLTSTGQFVGTLDYIAPETIEGKTIDGSVDQYSLACACYELFTGEPPFQRDLGLALLNAHLSTPPPKITARRPELPPAVDLVLAKAMAKNPADRYASCVAFATDLGKAIGMVPGTPLVVAAGAQPTAVAGNTPQQAPHPMTELASQVTAAEGAAGPVLAVGGEQPTRTTPPPQQMPPQQMPPQQMPPQQMPPQQMPPQQPWQGGQQPWQGGQQPWQGGQQGGGYGPQYQPGYQQQYPQQYQPQFGTGPIGPPISGTGPIGPPLQNWGPQGQQTGQNWQQQQQQQQNKNRGLLIGAVVATLVIAAAAVAVVYLVIVPKKNNNNAGGGGGHSTSISTSPTNGNSSSSNTQPQPTARSEATAINTLLSNSAQSRSQWDASLLVSDVGNCVNINSDVTQIGDIAAERASELNQARNLQVGAIPNGAILKSELMNALHISLNIDKDYLAWARQQQSSGCSVGTNSSYYDQATSEDPNATAAKTTFLDAWDPLASQYNLQQFSADQI